MHELLAAVVAFRDERNWRQFHTPKDLAIAVSVEAAELLELFQWRSTNEPIEPQLRSKLQDEMADVLLYLLLLADASGVDLLAAAHGKLERNRLRFPVSISYGVSKPADVSEKL